MMHEAAPTNVPVHKQGRPFPWFCPKCRRKEVHRVTIPYECQRLYNGQPITVVIAALTVPQCANCGELVFTYETEEQINRAYQAQAGDLGNGSKANGELAGRQDPF